MIDWISLSPGGVGERLGTLDMVEIPGTGSSRFFRFGGTRIGWGRRRATTVAACASASCWSSCIWRRVLVPVERVLGGRKWMSEGSMPAV